MERKIREAISTTWKHSRKLIVFLLGSLVVLVGIAMIVLPGPAIVVIPAGLLILSSEFLWARKLLVQCKGFFRHCKAKFGGKKERENFRKKELDIDRLP